MHVFFWREAWRSFSAHRGLAWTAVFSLTAALTLVGILLTLSWNASRALRSIGDRREMVVYLRDDVSDAQVQPLLDRVRQYYGIPTYVSRAQAWEEFAQQVGDPELLKAVDQNPLPASVRIRLKPELLNYASMEQAAQQMAQLPEVEDVRYGAEWVRRLDEVSGALHRGTLAAGVVVAVAVVFILYNTLRLTVIARRQQVEIMTRLGATDRFVATPFVIEAVIQTLVATALSLAIVFGLQQAVAARIAGLVFLPPLWIGAFAAGAALLAWAAGSWVLARTLRHVGA
jgi:cell division transport system permease protein